jgi:hypothetical protein
MEELKTMMKTLLKQNEEDKKLLQIARCEANDCRLQMQHWVKTCQSPRLQVLELQKAIETLSQGSFWSGSRLSSVTTSLEKVHQMHKESPIPMEVILNRSADNKPMMLVSDGKSQMKDDGNCSTSRKGSAPTRNGSTQFCS